MLDHAHFTASGFVVLRASFDADALAAELERALGEGLVSSFAAGVGGGEVRGQYLPMMNARTPRSLALLDALEPVAAELLGGLVLPTRAKGVRYFGSTPWHRDSERRVASVGFAAYFEPLDAVSGALRVLPGSHRGELAAAAAEYLASKGGAGIDAIPGLPVPTIPGDVIAFDEHLFHASRGGTTRRQWRADYVRDPAGAEEVADVRAYFADIYPPGWDGGYDAGTYPSYGPDWMGSGRASVARLEALGVYALAAAQEAAARARREG